ncbi:MAG TPA: hypothetical protein VM238_13315, partial [Phycisphaerae bacterium]|nr:hypothetical protein [Phycisphaerae bacterium]
RSDTSVCLYTPTIIKPRSRPPVLAAAVQSQAQAGRFIVADIYKGLTGVRPGEVKALRVIEETTRISGIPPGGRWWNQAFLVSWQGSYVVKNVLGTVPVEADGSAYFAVPADRFVYFQLLDAAGMMVQSMRSGTIARPGETLGCVGCHESRHSAVPNLPKKALGRTPDKLKPWYGAPRLFNYRTEVQPVFDTHCVRCHDFGKKGATKLVLAGDLTRSFNVSYMELRRKKLVNVVGAGPPDVQMPYSWGSHASKMVKVLREGHNDLRLDAESFDRIVTWIDINAPYYPSYASVYPDNLYGRCPLDAKQLAALGKLTGKKLTGEHHEPLICFNRPELSPCLAGLKEQGGPRYAEALAIIRAGRQMLAARPRMDMRNADLYGIDADREAKYRRLDRLQGQARDAIVAGRKHYEAAGEGGE